MKPLDLVYFAKCVKLIEDQLGIGHIESWKQRDYEKLCELIQQKTKVSLSLSTIKRILNNGINHLPQKATLDALAQFVGFNSWFDFIKQNPEIQTNGFTDANNSSVSGMFRQKNKYFIPVLLFVFLMLVGFVSIWIHRSKVNMPDKNIIVTIDTLSGKKFKNIALTPPMGWNSWNSFHLIINEELIKNMADLLVKTGMRDAGYQYLIIDDGWQAKSRDSQGNLMADTSKFPGGLKTLADYVHSKGLKFGIYSCTGDKSWSWAPGGRGHEFQDARTFASWGVDFLKYDWSSKETANAMETYRLMRDALYSAGRPVLFSICEWGVNQPWRWGKDIGHMWRTTGDITDCLDCKETFAIGWKNILDKQVGLELYAGPDHWNDPDMLEVGNPGLSLKESKSHFSLWCMLAAPLIAGNDLSKMSMDIQLILTNKEAIAIDQDIKGKQGSRISNEDGKEIWVKELSEGNWAICFFNSSKNLWHKQINWQDFTMLNGHYNIRDIWKLENIGTTYTPLFIDIKSNEVLFLKLTGLNGLKK